MTRLQRPARHGVVLLALWVPILAGCGGVQVAVPPELPVPLVQRLPLTMGIYLSDDLVSYVYKKKLEQGGEWEIDLGSAQANMFNNLLSGMFKAVRPVAAPDAPDSSVDGILIPSIEEVQFSTPDQTRSDYFEVWVRYRFQLRNQDGTLVGEWPMTAYGKADAGNYGLNARKPALQAAAISALRDAMAFFTVQFHTVPAVRSWLNAELKSSTSS